MMNGNLKLVFVRYINNDIDDNYIYELLFSETPEIVWGQFWDSWNPSSCGDLTPDKTTFSIVKRIASPYKLTTVQETSCYTMEHAVNRIIALSWVDINPLDEYPPEGRMVLHFGDDIDVVERILSSFEIELE